MRSRVPDHQVVELYRIKSIARILKLNKTKYPGRRKKKPVGPSHRNDQARESYPGSRIGRVLEKMRQGESYSQMKLPATLPNLLYANHFHYSHIMNYHYGEKNGKLDE